MSRKVLIALTLVAGVLAACKSPAQPPPELHVAQGPQFVPQVVEFSNNVGSSPSLGLDSSNNPVVTYLGYKTNLTPGEVPEVRSIISAPLPNVLFANIQHGYWNLGGVAAQNTGSGVQAGDDQLGTIKVDKLGVQYPYPLAATSLAMDPAGNMHVAWSQRDGIQYSTNATGDFKAQTVAKGVAWAPSIALDQAGNPWIAYMTAKTVDVATLSGSKWVTEQVGPAPKCADVCTATRTAIVAGKNGPIVAYTGPDSPMLAIRAADGTWTSNVVARGDAGFGVSLAADKAGALHMAYYDGGANVFVADATADGKITGQPVKVGSSVGGIQAAGTWGTTITTDDKGTRYVAWTDPTANTVVLASDQSGDFKNLNTPGTQSGSNPSLEATADGSKIYLAWYDTNNANLQVGTYSDVTKAPALAVVSPSPQNSNAAPPPAAGCTPNGSTLKLVAPAGAATSGFDTDCLAAPANKPFKIDFSNQDTSPHNVVIIVSGPPSASAKYIFNNTKPVDPGTSATYPIAAQKPGSYFYYCFFHPTVMTGTLVVK